MAVVAPVLGAVLSVRGAADLSPVSLMCAASGGAVGGPRGAGSCKASPCGPSRAAPHRVASEGPRVTEVAAVYAPWCFVL